MAEARYTHLPLMSGRRYYAADRHPAGSAAMDVGEWESSQGAAWATVLDVD